MRIVGGSSCGSPSATSSSATRPEERLSRRVAPRPFEHSRIPELARKGGGPAQTNVLQRNHLGEMGDAGWKSTDSFGRDDLLLLAKVIDQTHSWILQAQLYVRKADIDKLPPERQ